MMIKRRTLLKGMAAAPAVFALGSTLDGAGALAGPSPRTSLLDVTYPPKDNFGLVFMEKPLDRDITWADLVKALKRTLPSRSVDQVLDSANRHGTDGGLPDNPPRADHWFWQDGDRNDDNWVPQGLTTSADYHQDGKYNGREVQLASWYSRHATNKGVRVSFVDMTDPSKPAYRHVLLVEPTGSVLTPDFKAIKIHAGGIMWYGDLLYVADTYNGLRVFDMKDLLAVTSNGDQDKIGRQPDGTYQAHNYAFVLPQSSAYNSIVHNQPEVQYSWISLDRTSTPDSIVIGEFMETADRASRLFKWDIDATTRKLKETSGVAEPSFAAVVDIDRMQGGTCIKGKFYLARSNSNNAAGDLLTWKPGSYVQYPITLPPYPEDVSYDVNKDWLWCHTETNDARQVFALKVSQIP
ncbi:hypothetical protein [Actinomadura decatromicini]|uniref:Secreted protein n=1 Tax=Actinomadura decatromicini TaxID=2604572 RepID=A0A5D3FAN4_9ACTN|nr:hypothetical protein [Actinomadura decatromicini]TYK46017.1 hypothetical protein FXF68_27795 [Actinomadura decatromicini]